MNNFLITNQSKINTSSLDDGLQDFFDKGIVQKGDGFFFNKIFDSSERYSVNDDFETYTDLSGFENTMNRFHVDDFSSKDSFIEAFVFLRAFKENWRNSHTNLDCQICIGFQDDEICKTSTFTFHIFRKNEVIYDTENIEEYINPIYLERF